MSQSVSSRRQRLWPTNGQLVARRRRERDPVSNPVAARIFFRAFSPLNFCCCVWRKMVFTRVPYFAATTTTVGPVCHTAKSQQGLNMNPVTLSEVKPSKGAQESSNVMENQKVWVAEPTEGFILGHIVDLGSEEVTVQPVDRRFKAVNCAFDRVFPAEENDAKDFDDNCGLMYLNEATLLHNVRLRYMKDHIYTYVANILIAVNPYADIKNLYSSKCIADYRGKSIGVLPPHVFAIADKAFRDMKVLKQSQSIIVSGESGAGKTESTKYVLRYLCETGGHAAGPIESRILDANPVLEAFGNAKTTRNNNSSRFGKFIEIHFSDKQLVVGGYISHYLLEKSRICGQSPEERNYHIFYQLCAGAPEALRKQLRLGMPDQYQYLNKGCTQFFGRGASGGGLHDPLLDDAKDFARMDKSLQTFNVTEPERLSIYSTVAAVLHLGNVSFEENPDDSRGGCRVAAGSEAALAAAASLLGVNAGELQQALLSRVMQTAKGGYKGTIIMVPLKPWEATSARDALAKAVYSKLFDYIVNKINRSIPFQSSAHYIGVLDIAGFANPVLEAFGNAKTTRNNNSSRFGKFIEIHFSDKQLVVGGYISHYLLEKSRICGQSPEERNYHIFYQLCAGAPEALRKQLRLGMPDQYQYLNKGCTQFFGRGASGGGLHDPLLDDAKDFARMDKSLQTFSVTEPERLSIYSTVAAVLHLGNVSFEENPDDSRGGCRVAAGSEAALAAAASLLGVNAGELQQALLSRVMQTAKGGYKGTIIMVPLKPWEATSARDALAKAVYSKLFDYIVNKINSFEQFCINYCNEKLQMFFNERVLHDEQALYSKEGLNVPKIDYVDNQDCIDLLEAKATGIIDLLNEEGKLPKSSAAHFTAAVHQNHGQHFRLALPRRSRLKQHRELRDEEGFIVRHFAGAVCYHTAQFIDKNNDALHTSLEALMSESRNDFLQALFDGSDVNLNKGKLTYISVATKFRGQLEELMEKLHSTGTSFIRCIKPNVRMVSREFDGGAILSQLQCAGMGSVLELMQQGYPSRQSLFDMYQKYLPGKLASLNPRMFCKALFRALGLNEHDFKFGMTKVFFRAGKFAEFDQMLKSDPENLAALVKKVHRWLLCSRWKKAMWGTLMVIKLKNKIKFRKENLVIIQKTVRMHQAKKQHRPRYLGIMRIKDLKNNVSQMSRIVSQLKTNRDNSAKIVAQMDANLNSTIKKIRANPKITKKEIDKEHATLVAILNKELAALKTELEKQKSAEEQERLRKIQEQMELNRKREEEEARKKREEEENRKKKAEMEARRKKEEEEAKLSELAAKKLKIGEDALKKKEIEEDQLARQQLEQERRDHELALRLANEMGTQLSSAASTPRLARAPGIKNGTMHPNTSKHDLSKWKYSELRDTINTSCDLDLLEACRVEFHRRLKVYHAWKARNKKRNSGEETERAPPMILEAAKFVEAKLANGVGGLSVGDQRYFRIPFLRPNAEEEQTKVMVSTSGQKGWWFAHFDGQYIARQMELHDDKSPLLLVAGKDDMQMCELALEETGLTRKKGAEILEHEFEKEWTANGGQVYVRAADRAKR
ncbi:unnamed protein product [Notodromas monacha]|uniref:Unconventional myosin-VI n=1 Tax=Notodromas monacha TaxID=399045 RepID=A0A7R9BUE4_9CRUS|nr:unnamed protein product [Notodromas monacha]CAG0920544.1 unnamed protein product [Notodromas monacha]